MYRALFQRKEFLASRQPERWPKNPEEQELEFHYGDQAERVADLQANVSGLNLPPEPYLESAPMTRLSSLFQAMRQTAQKVRTVFGSSSTSPFS